MTDRPTLRQDAFRAWLLDQPRSVPCGLARWGGDCPLARFLGPGWEVHPLSGRWNAYAFDVPEPWPLPRWACRFAEQVDALPLVPRKRGRMRLRRVYPATALAILDELLVQARAETADAGGGGHAP